MIKAEQAPAVEIGPMCDMRTQEGRDALWRWILEMHVTCCSKCGVDCKACKDAERRGIARPS